MFLNAGMSHVQCQLKITVAPTMKGDIGDVEEYRQGNVVLRSGWRIERNSHMDTKYLD